VPFTGHGQSVQIALQCRDGQNRERVAVQRAYGYLCIGVAGHIGKTSRWTPSELSNSLMSWKNFHHFRPRKKATIAGFLATARRLRHFALLAQTSVFISDLLLS
jgi:hypothetical protein